jgi:transcription termination factor Rho
MARGRRGGRGRGGGRGGQHDAGAAPRREGTSERPAAVPAGAAGGERRGVLEVDDRGRGFLRDPARHFAPDRQDPTIDAGTVRQLDLRPGSEVVLTDGRVASVDGMPPERAREVKQLRFLTTIDPTARYVLEGPGAEGAAGGAGDLTCRAIDLIAPLGKGQRALVVAPPRTGKTILLQKIANRIAAGYPAAALMVLLVNERPEEATDFRRSVKGQVFYSTADEPDTRHVHLVEMAGARARRLAELGRDVVMLVDSLTRIGRAYNAVIAGQGRTLSGGLDASAMQRPKAFFGSARNIEEGGSLTIVATALIDTGSRMDEVIFEEFKGTGNMELVLDRDLADHRVFPAIDVQKSGTRREERLVPPETLAGMHTLRKVLLKMRPSEATPLLLKKLAETSSNADFLERFRLGEE